MFEIEIKFALNKDQAGSLLEHLKQSQGQYFIEDKSDIYFMENPDHQSPTEDFQRVVRMRINNNEDPVVTFKQRRIDNGIEVNRETEFGIAATKEQFIAMMDYMNWGHGYQKHKISHVFAFSDHRIEISEIKKLGYFLEIEVLVDSEAEVAGAQTRLTEVSASLGFDRANSEPRSYSTLLFSQHPNMIQPISTAQQA